MDEVANHADREEAGDGASRLVMVALQPIRLDVLGLVLRSQSTRVELDARAGAGKLLGNVATQLLHALNRLDLAPAADEFMGQAGDTLRSFAHLASGRKLEQGTEMARILSRMAAQKASAGLRRILHRSEPSEPAS